MQADSIHQAAVLGAGTMGHGIAQVLAQAGIRVCLFDVNEDATARGLAAIKANLAKGVARGKVTTEQEQAALGQLCSTTVMSKAVEGVQLVVEAVPEKIELKHSIFQELGKLDGGVLLASNTSSLSIDSIAQVADHPERVLGMHFFNPVHLMKLVEVVRGEATSEEAVQCALDLSRRLGKTPIEVKDAPGFASSRLGIAIGLEAMRMLEEGVASAEDIDTAMTLGYGFPMGPLKLTDLVGLDVRLAIAEYLESALGERFSPPAILRDKVARGELGKKSGQGFHTWDK